jgi:hypothetical protein
VFVIAMLIGMGIHKLFNWQHPQNL